MELLLSITYSMPPLLNKKKGLGGDNVGNIAKAARPFGRHS
jgi:hypothetical protein